MTGPRLHIGTLREKPLHASLKDWYAQPGDQIETAVDGYVIDLVRDGLLIEVQTRGFSGIKAKVGTLLDFGHTIRIVHPIPVDKWIVKIDGDGTIIDRRRSPKHGVPVDIVSELVSFPDRLVDPGLEVEVLLTNEEEYRVHTPDRSRRRKGWSVLERRLIEVTDSYLIRSPAELAGLLPQGLRHRFTTADLADQLPARRRTAQQLAYCLKACGAITAIGKQGNAVVYQMQ